MEIREQIAIGQVLGDETEWLLFSDAANQSNDVRIVSLGNALHQSNLVDEILSFWAISKT